MVEPTTSTNIKSDIANKIFSLNKAVIKREPPAVMIHLQNIGVSQKSLSMKLNTSQTSISHLATGMKKIDSDTFQALHDQLSQAVAIAEVQIEKISDIYPEDRTIEYRQIVTAAKQYIGKEAESWS
jgi:DNA-directed RNA polymerase subunit F